MKEILFLAAIGISLVFATTLASPANGYLRLHPDNPHYFQETSTGKAVLIVTHGNCAPSSHSIDYKKEVETSIREKMIYSRIWHLLPWEGDKGLWPWAKSSVSGALYGGNKFDFNTWDPVYWNTLKDCLDRCQKAGIYAEIFLYDACGMKQDTHRWHNNPWAPDNNINNTELPSGQEQGVPDFYYVKDRPNVKKFQDSYVKKLIDETIAFPNVIYEIENEHYPGNEPEWTLRWSKFIKDYIKEKYPDSPRLVAQTSDFDVCFEAPLVDIVNYHSDSTDVDSYNRFLEGNWKYGKAMNVDELANHEENYDALRRVCWTIVTSGGHFHIEDALAEAKPYEIARNVLEFLSASNWDFVHCAPNKQLVKSGKGFSMAQPGVQYVFYFPTAGNKELDIAKGQYNLKWWNTRTGGFSGAKSVSHLGGTFRISTPDDNDWVLYMSKA